MPALCAESIRHTCTHVTHTDTAKNHHRTLRPPARLLWRGGVHDMACDLTSLPLSADVATRCVSRPPDTSASPVGSQRTALQDWSAVCTALDQRLCVCTAIWPVDELASSDHLCSCTSPVTRPAARRGPLGDKSQHCARQSSTRHRQKLRWSAWAPRVLLRLQGPGLHQDSAGTPTVGSLGNCSVQHAGCAMVPLTVRVARSAEGCAAFQI